jgi:8-oxo-dGTP pyrophosphatase MutT (NUDIX family)
MMWQNSNIISHCSSYPRAQYSGYKTRKKTVVFLLLFENHGMKILGIQKSDNPGYPWRNQIALPGGHIDETDKSPLDAALRELYEEVNIEKEEVSFQYNMGHFPTIKNIDIEVMVGLWKKKPLLVFDKTEISRIVEIPLEQLISIHKSNDFSKSIPTVEKLIYTVDDPHKNYLIWGVTARILYHLIESLRLDNT